jgi:hypothetical protein
MGPQAGKRKRKQREVLREVLVMEVRYFSGQNWDLNVL